MPDVFDDACAELARQELVRREAAVIKHIVVVTHLSGLLLGSLFDTS